MAIQVRPPQSEAEIEAAFALVHALAEHENLLEDLKISEAAFVDAASGDRPQMHILLAIVDGNILGMASYTERFHIWNGTALIELDDLYVSPEARGDGLGTTVLKALGQIAKKRDIPIKWQVLPENRGAIALYERMGARVRTSGVCFWQPEDMVTDI